MADDEQVPLGDLAALDASAPGWRPLDPRIQRAVRIVEDAPFPSPQSAELAEALGFSEFHFSRLFHAEVGKTVGVYARDMCLGQAAFRLKVSDAPIQDLYADYGYGSQAAFTRAFTARFGAPPATYRDVTRKAAALSALPPPLDVRLHRRASKDGLLWRYVGPPDRRTDGWRVFADQVAADDLGPGEWFGLMHDDPRVARPEEFRFDMGFAPARRSVFLSAPSRYERFRTTAGFYGTVLFSGPYASVGDGYGALLRVWLRQQTRFVIAGEPIMESFIAGPPRSPADERQVEISLKLSVKGRPVNWWEGAEQRMAAEREWRSLLRPAPARSGQA